MNTPSTTTNLTPEESGLNPAKRSVELAPVAKAVEDSRDLINESIQLADETDDEKSGSLDTDEKPIPKNVKTAFPLLGNYLFSVTGPFIDFAKAKELKREYPELFEVMKKKRAEIIKALGIRNLSELHNRSDDKEFVKVIRERVALAMVDDLVSKDIQTNLKSGDKNKPGHTYLPAETIQSLLLKLSESKLKSLADEADTLIKYVDEKFFPNTGSNPPTGIINEIENEHDIGKLILIVADEKKYDVQTRYQALRKIAFIELFAKMTKIDEDRASQHNCLSFLDDVFNSGLYSKRDGRKIGHYETKYLMTHLNDEGDYVYSDLLADQNEAKAMVKSNPSLQSTPIPMRTFEIEDENGELVEGLVDSRVKTRLSEALKMLRKNTIDPNEALKDLNGLRLAFESEEKIKLFENAFEKKLKSLGAKVEIYDQENEVGKGKLKFRKTNIEIDGKHYEFQIFTFNEFANYLYKQPYSWPEYEVDRFHGSSSSEATHPSDVNPDLDRKEAAELARVQARHTVIGKVWESNGNGNGRGNGASHK